MNVFHVFARRCLKENRTRTTVTIIGIVLSMALFTAVIEGAYSGIQFLVRGEMEKSGSWLGMYCEVDGGDEEKIESCREVKDTVSWQTVGWAEIGSENEYKPYLMIQSVEDSFTDLVQINLSAGRMPENDSELLLPTHLYSNGAVSISLGDVLELEVGKRMSNGYILSSHMSYIDDGSEAILETELKKYTVVGFYERFNPDIEFFDCPGYTAITTGAGGYRKDVFFTLNNPRRFEKVTQDGVLAELGQKLIRHNDLLDFYGVTRYSGINALIGGFAAVLVVLVSFGSISLIYNSFAISVNERVRLFGILKSVGATKKQIKSTMLYEASFLAFIAIPIGLVVGCVGIGITLYALRDSFNAFVDVNRNTQMKLVLNPIALLASVLACYITILISAYIPARKAIKLSPVDSIRQADDIKIRPRDVRTSKLTLKLFGFEGMMAAKNFKRSKKRYRSVVFSLFTSVVLFVSASSFCSYLNSSVGAYSSEDPGADICYYMAADSFEEAKKTAQLLQTVPGVNNTLILAEGWMYSAEVSKDALTKGYMEAAGLGQEDQDKVIMDIKVQIVDDASFSRFCRENKLDESKYRNTSAPCGIFINNVGVHTTDEKGNYKYVPAMIFRDDSVPMYLKGRVWDPDEPEKLQQIYVTDLVEKSVPGFSYNQEAVVYPECQAEHLFGKGSETEIVSMKTLFFEAENHAAVFDKMKTLLVENGMDSASLMDLAEGQESTRMIVKVVNVFSYGFIILISLIALVNVFNTISTNIILRRREFAMLKSLGLSEKGFSKMMRCECLIYGLKGLGFGLPASVLVTYWIYTIVEDVYDRGFYMPPLSIIIAVGSVFIVVFSTMIYSSNKIRHDNLIDALKNENI